MRFLIIYHKPESKMFAKHMTNMFADLMYPVTCCHGMPTKQQIKSANRIFLLDFGVEEDETSTHIKSYRHMRGRPVYLVQQSKIDWDIQFTGLQRMATSLKIMAVLGHTADPTCPIGGFHEMHYPYTVTPNYGSGNPSVVCYDGDLPKEFNQLNPELQFRKTTFSECSYYLHFDDISPSLYTYRTLKAILNQKLPIFSEDNASSTPIGCTTYNSRKVISRKETDMQYWDKVDNNFDFVKAHNEPIKVYNTIRMLLKNVE